MNMKAIWTIGAVYFAALAIGYFVLMQSPEVQAGLESQMAGKLVQAWLCGCF